MQVFDLKVSEAVKELSTIQDFIRWGVTHFNQSDLVYGHGTDNAWDEAVHLVLSSLKLPPDSDANILGSKLTTSEKEFIVENVKKRVQDRIPVPYLIKEAWFAGLNFYVDERVIIPRSPLAELIEEDFSPWVEVDNIHSILDMCTGSGCIAVSCALNFPNVHVDAVDISEDALDVAQINVERFGVEDQVRLVESNLFQNLKDEKYDIIVTNPPYVRDNEIQSLPSEFKHEPTLALEAGEDGLDCVSRILVEAQNFLSANGILVVEVGFLQEAMEEKYPDVPFTWLQFEHGGEGVFLLTAQELSEFNYQLKKRGLGGGQ